tara:strand:- start:6312 stop:7211 length:900 start_codon:yes stop_codon:yes gene_type:complete
MVGSKSRPNKSDEDNIIDMEPIDPEKRVKVFSYVAFFISILVFILSLSSSYWIIDFYIPEQLEQRNYQMKSLKNNLEDNKKLYKKNIEKLRVDYNNIKVKLKDFDIKNSNSKVKLDIDNLNQLVTSIEKKIDLMSIRISTLDDTQNFSKEKISRNQLLKNTKPNQELISSNNQNKIVSFLKKDNYKEVKNNLLVEADLVIQKLLKRKDFGFISNKDEISKENTYFERVKNYLAGALKLREFSESLSPRSLITQAEKEIKNGNIEAVIELLKQLPKNWRNPADQFILKVDGMLNKKVLSE